MLGQYPYASAASRYRPPVSTIPPCLYPPRLCPFVPVFLELFNHLRTAVSTTVSSQPPFVNLWDAPGSRTSREQRTPGTIYRQGSQPVRTHLPRVRGICNATAQDTAKSWLSQTPSQQAKGVPGVLAWDRKRGPWLLNCA